MSPSRRQHQLEYIGQQLANCSDVTVALIAQLVQRDQMGRAKYGTTLDRTDLTLDQWLQHQVEELLDGAGYALAAMRTNQAPVPETPGCAHDWLYYRGYSDGELYAGRHCRNCAEEWRGGVKVTPDAAEFNRDGD